MRVSLEILKPGDSVFSVWDSHVAVKKPSGEVEIFQYYLDKENFPRLSEGTILVTFGDGVVRTTVNEHDEDEAIEVTTF